MYIKVVEGQKLLVSWSVRAPVLLLLTVRTVPSSLVLSWPLPGSAPDSQVNPRLDRLIFLPKRCCRFAGSVLREPRNCCYVTVPPVLAHS